MKPKRMDKDTVQRIASDAVTSAVSFIEADIEPLRQKCQKYFNGEVDLKTSSNRSKIVSTKCRDAVRQVKPSLLRVFASTDRPVEFVPRSPQHVAAAEQATAYAQYAFHEAGGFKLLAGAFHDALVKKTGVLKFWWDENSDVEVDEYTDLTEPEFMLIAQDPEVEILEHEARQDIVMDPLQGEVPVTLHSAKVARTNTTGKIAIQAIPPEDFFVDSSATCSEDSYVIGHKTEMRVGDLVGMGFAFDDVFDLGVEGEDDEAEEKRRSYTPDDSDESALDPSMRPVTVYEAYMKIDVEGAGVPQLYSLILAGSNKRLLSYELADSIPFAVFEIDPEPHAFFGRSLVEILLSDQDVGTAMLRSLIDNVLMTNTPGYAADDQAVNLDDLLSPEIGKVVRTRGIPGDKIMPLSVPFAAGQTLPALEYFDHILEGKTGVSRASLGLDPDALASGTTATAVQATVAGSEGQVEVMARNLAEGGMKQLFRGLLKLAAQHVGPEELIRVDGKFVQVDPASWRIGMGMSVNVGLGTGRRDERAATLREMLNHQVGMYQNFGPGMVWMGNIRNTLADIMDAAGIRNADRYFLPMDQQQEIALMQQKMQQQGHQDPNAGLAQAEVMKAQISAQQKSQSDMARLQLDAQKAAADDDLKRDKMYQDMALKSAEIQGRHNLAVDQARIQQMQQAPRG